MNDTLGALSVSTEWHRFLYRSVLLEWETTVRYRQTFPRFNARKPLCGVTLIKVAVLKNTEATIAAHALTAKPMERLFFYSSEKAFKDLFALLRNCVAHAHYSSPRRGWIAFHHQHQGKTKLSGQVKFSSLKELTAQLLADSRKNGGVV